MPLVLGITGNIASGKSSVAREFERLGAVIVDADQLAREVVEPGSPTLAALVGEFGEGILQADGHLDRDRLGEIIFSDAAARNRLNAIIHPAIGALAVARLEELRRRDDIPLVIYEAPLLFEAGAEGRVDRVLVVKIDPQQQLKRLKLRDGSTTAEAQKRIAAQMAQEEKLARADDVIDNSGDFAATIAQVDRLWQQLVEK
ncbi:MAG: dephospho-CoA kinase [Desulfuromonas sp.]|nr:MAG: dephospho-CoA kinase [Desulfuromonas sp.]